MAYSITEQSGVVTYGLVKYVVNSTADVASVPTDAASGSEIIVIGTGDKYMLSVKSSGVKSWVLIGSENNNNG